jgi:uncharacterized alkaline shock family protein YloU
MARTGSAEIELKTEAIKNITMQAASDCKHLLRIDSGKSTSSPKLQNNTTRPELY